MPPTVAARRLLGRRWQEANHVGGSGFWGYNVYRENPSTTTYGFIGRWLRTRPARPRPTASPTPGPSHRQRPGRHRVGPDLHPPTATNPGIECAGTNGSWLPATSTDPDSSISPRDRPGPGVRQGQRPHHYDPAALVTGEHSGPREPEHALGLPGHRGHGCRD